MISLFTKNKKKGGSNEKFPESTKEGKFVFIKEKIKKIFFSFGPREKYLISLFALIIAGSLLAIGVQIYLSNTKSIPIDGGEYKEAIIGSPRFINPVLSTANDADRDLASLIYSGLVKYDPNGEIVADLADDFKISDDGKEYRFILKPNLLWEDGKPLTADDVIFTIETIQNPKYSSPLYQSWQGVKISIDEEQTIVFKLSNSYPTFLENATIGIIPQHIWNEVKPQNFALSDINLQPIGSGPFKLYKFTKTNSGLISSYTLTKNDNYHNKKPYIDKLTFKFYASEEDAIKAYNSNATDGIAFVSPTNIELLRDAKNINLYEFKMPRSFTVFLNQSQNTLLVEKKIREAITYATNKNELIDIALNGFGQISNTPIPPNLIKYYNENLNPLQYDIEKAKSILSEQGWEDLDEDGIREKIPQENKESNELQRLAFSIITANKSELIKVAELLKQQWARAGIGLNILSMELGELQQNYIHPRSYEMLLFGTILSTIPDPYPFWHSSQTNDRGLNLAKYKNDDVDKILETARRELNEQKRIEQYKEFQKLVTNDLPAIFLYDPSYIYPVNKGIQGIKPALIVSSSRRFVGIENWYIETKRVF